MKFRLIVLAMLCLGFACNAQNQIDRQGRKQGHWIKTDKNGSKIFEGDFQDGLETGTFNYYYPDGTLRIKNVYTKPGRYCSHEAYDEKGKLVAKGFYNQKNRDGEWRFYSEDGRLVKIAGYRMGVKEGPHIIFTAKGDTAEISTWKDNRRNGRWWKRIGENGYITGTYVNGGLEGRLLEYGNDGKLVREGSYKNGQKHGTYRYFENGVLTVDEVWSKDVMADRKVLVSAPNKTYISIYAIAYLLPKGSSGTTTLLYKMDGSSITCQEDIETINSRIGHEIFVTVDRKSRVTANTACINGTTKDAEDRVILSLDPNPPFSIFPDDDCIRMVKSLQRIDELDE